MILLNIQFWQGDKELAMGLARLIADLEDAPRPETILFTARFDCEFDEETIAYVAKKFQVARFKTTRKATGWPNGPNQMMGESYQYLVELRRRGRFEGSTGILFIEADCVPLKRGWIDDLTKEYESCGKHVLGAWLKSGDVAIEHVNGNCIISFDFWRKCPQICNPPSRGGWDAVLAPYILPSAAPSRLIWSDYQLGTSKNPWKGDMFLWEPKAYKDPKNALYGQKLHPVWFHGIKGDMGLNAAKTMLLGHA